MKPSSDLTAMYRAFPVYLWVEATQAHVMAMLARHHAECSAMLSNGEWLIHYSGKEILTEIMTMVWTKKRPPDPQFRLDFVMAVGRAQRDLKRVPVEITELRTELLARVGLPP